MARINNQTKYSSDTIITNNDFLIGSDGDNLDVTKTFSVLILSNYIKTQIFQDIVLENGGWGLLGNDNINQSNFIGTINQQPLIFKTNNLERFRILPTGEIRIQSLPNGNITEDILVIGNNGDIKSLSSSNFYLSSNPNGYTDNLGTVTNIEFISGTNGTDINIIGSPVNTNGTITINIPTASSVNRGALSNTDWTIFNNKQDLLISGTNVKTINGNSLLGNGDLILDSGSLEAIDEGNGIGYVLRGRNSANYGNIGLNAKDLSFSDTLSTTFGATGNNSFCANYRNTVSGSNSSAFGSDNVNNSQNSIISGTNNTIQVSQNSSIVNGHSNSLNNANALTLGNAIFGISNTANPAGSGCLFITGQLNTVNGTGNSVFGFGNTVVSGTYSIICNTANISNANNTAVFGDSNRARSNNEFCLGFNGTDYTPNGTNDRVFNIGNGTSSTLRADAFTVLKGGNVGINVNLPTAKLDINGDLRVRTLPTGLATENIVVVNGTGNIKSITPFTFLNAHPNFGVWNYNNSLANQSITASTWTKVQNNGGGANTYLGGALSGVTIYDTTNYQLDYTDLELYDSVDIRFDTIITTTSANQEVSVRLLLSVGVLNIPLTFINAQFKTAGTHSLVGFIQNHIFTNAVKDNPAQIEIWSDASCTLATNGWAIKVNKRIQ